MDFDEAARIVEGVPVPHISAGQGRALYQHIRESRPESVLELGTARGGAAVVIAAALEANGAGHLTGGYSARWQWLGPSAPGGVAQGRLTNWVMLYKRFLPFPWFS